MDVVSVDSNERDELHEEISPVHAKLFLPSPFAVTTLFLFTFLLLLTILFHFAVSFAKLFFFQSACLQFLEAAKKKKCIDDDIKKRSY